MRFFLGGLALLWALCGAGCNCDFRHRPPAVQGLARDEPSAALSAVWVGHSTVLLRVGATRVLADADFSSHQFIYPRLTPSSIELEALPKVDVALVSHLHSDHFDVEALRQVGPSADAIFPDGAGLYTHFLPERVIGLERWESVETHGLRITAVPARHSGGRWLVDGLWNHAYTGYVIEGAGQTVYFAGDTGYDPKLFKEIGRRFPAIDLAFIPIAPARGGDSAHASPSEALDLFRDLGARFLVPIHYEAFYSAVVPYDEPRRLLAAETARRGWQDRVFALHPGEGWALLPGGAAPEVIREAAGADSLARTDP